MSTSENNGSRDATKVGLDALNKGGLKIFNETYHKFLLDVVESFPEYADIIKQNYFDKRDSKPLHYYMKHYMYEVFPHMIEIANCDGSIFTKEEAGLYLLEGVNFNELWAKTNETTQKDIWKYLHFLFMLANNHKNIDHLIIHNRTELSSLNLIDPIKEVRSKRRDINDQINKVLIEQFESSGQLGEDKNDDDEDGDGNMMSMLSSMLGEDFNLGETLQDIQERLNDENSEFHKLAGDMLDDATVNEFEQLASDPSKIFTALMETAKKGNLSDAGSTDVSPETQKTEKINDLMGGIIQKIMGRVQSGEVDVAKLQTEGKDFMDKLMGGKMGQMFGTVAQNLIQNNPDMVKNMMENFDPSQLNTDMFSSMGNMDGIMRTAQQMAQQNPDLVRMAQRMKDPHNGNDTRARLRRKAEELQRQKEESDRRNKQ